MGGNGTRKGSLLMPKDFALEQIPWDGSAIDRDKGTMTT